MKGALPKAHSNPWGRTGHTQRKGGWLEILQAQ